MSMTACTTMRIPPTLTLPRKLNSAAAMSAERMSCRRCCTALRRGRCVDPARWLESVLDAGAETTTAYLPLQTINIFACRTSAQIIIDKVVVHHTLSTLAVVGTAAVLFLAFGGVLSWVRQYLVLHTGNRIDAVLGHRIVAHMLHLPPRYFEQRPVGTMVARLQGVDVIREFVCSAAITAVLDSPFLLVFIVLMFTYSWELALIAALLQKRIELIHGKLLFTCTSMACS